MSKVKRYEIETIEQLVNICTPENFQSLATDFLTWLDFANQMFADLKKSDEYKGKLNSEIASVKFIWLDDGKEGLKYMTLKDPRTGKIKKIKPHKDDEHTDKH
jgi:hypothetical protein